jgi:hypothetical protein
MLPAVLNLVVETNQGPEALKFEAERLHLLRVAGP